MSNPLELLLGDLDNNTDSRLSRIRQATISSVDPLRIRFDTEVIIMGGTPQTLVHPSQLAAGVRVHVLTRLGKTDLILGVAGGVSAGDIRPYLPLPESQSTGYGNSFAIGAAAAAWTSSGNVPFLETPNLPKKMRVRVDLFGVSQSGAVNNVYLMLGVKCSGATTLAENDQNTDGLSHQFGAHTPFATSLNANAVVSGFKYIDLEPGVTKLEMMFRRNVASTVAVGYPQMTITPIKWIDETPVVPAISSGGGLPTGSYLEHNGADLLDPFVWLPCDGRIVSRSTYAGLFAVIGTQFGAGDGSTTFAIPDRRNRVAVGVDPADPDLNAVGKKFGTKTHTLTTAQLAAHAHNVDGPIGGRLGGNNGAPGTGGNASGYLPWFGGGYGSGSAIFQNAGGGGAHNNMPPTIVANIYIKT